MNDDYLPWPADCHPVDYYDWIFERLGRIPSMDEVTMIIESLRNGRRIVIKNGELYFDL